MNPNYVVVVKHDIDKLLTPKFIQPYKGSYFVITNNGSSQEEWKT
jgi:hypothetical protein